MRVSLSRYPSPKQLHVLDMSNLTGGLNLWDEPYRVDKNQSPKMKNMWWVDGALGSRPGQEYIGNFTPTAGAYGYAMHTDYFHGYLFAHIGTKIVRIDPKTGTRTDVVTGVPANRGSFFTYDTKLYYKNRGGFYAISDTFAVSDLLATGGYVPIVLTGTNPNTGAGIIYQPENRLQKQKIVWYTAESGVTAYHLPDTEIENVDYVEVNGSKSTAYTVDKPNGIVNFTTAPPVSNPIVANTVRITYSKTNSKAKSAISDCNIATNYGGDQSLCIVMAGATAQSNAYFWNGNTANGMDPSYWPIDNYNLAGDATEAITAFGKQQAFLVVFKERGLGRTHMSTDMVDKRTVITMDYTPINNEIGCDLPWTVQLVDNNLVWCNTENGANFLNGLSSAYENMVSPISKNINGGTARPGLLYDLRVTEKDQVSSYDDGTHYWIIANGHAWVWDYELTTNVRQPEKLAWFYFEGINGVSCAKHYEEEYQLDRSGRLSHLTPNQYHDFGGAITQWYTFAVQNLGTYYNLKDVKKVILQVRSDNASTMNIQWQTDYGNYDEPTPVMNSTWSLVPRNLAFRSFNLFPFTQVAIRKPGYRHTRHFGIVAYNNNAGEDMSILGAQIYYNYQGEDRGTYVSE